MTGTQAGAGFPRSARLLRHADFDRVYKLGRRHFSPSMTVFYLQRQNLPVPDSTERAARAALSVPAGLRIGFTVGRALGGAVDRNRMKRRLREAVRQCRPLNGADADVVINPKKVLLTTDFTKIVDEVNRAFETIETKLRAKSNDKPAAVESSRRKKQEA